MECEAWSVWERGGPEGRARAVCGGWHGSELGIWVEWEQRLRGRLRGPSSVHVGSSPCRLTSLCFLSHSSFFFLSLRSVAFLRLGRPSASLMSADEDDQRGVGLPSDAEILQVLETVQLGKVRQAGGMELRRENKTNGGKHLGTTRLCPLPPGTCSSPPLFTTPLPLHALFFHSLFRLPLQSSYTREQVLSRLSAAGSGSQSGLDAVADFSTSLSLGEQQRVAWARLLLARPKLALLDEATSALDAATEEALYSVLEASGITYISIGHRPSLQQHHAQMLTIATGSVLLSQLR